jgi:hypothetical protein
MPCEECQELRTHRFRSSTDLVNALQVAAQEVDRGVLAMVVTPKGRSVDRSVAEEEALRSVVEAGALRKDVAYNFKCNICGDGFQLLADASLGTGEWKRNGEVA